jgi:hypothetical protein
MFVIISLSFRVDDRKKKELNDNMDMCCERKQLKIQMNEKKREIFYASFFSFYFKSFITFFYDFELTN